MKLKDKIKNGPITVLFTLLLMISLNLSGLEMEVFKQRREALMAKINEGLIIIQSTERNQNNLQEFFVDNSNNHDFIFFTGLENPEATLILAPGSKKFREILYINEDKNKIKTQTGLQHVFPVKNLLSDLSNSYTDFSLLRYSQIRFKPLPSEIARVLYNNGQKKIIYFNFPRFVNLAELPPKRLEFIKKIEYFSPKYEIRDISDAIDTLRMYHDEYGIQQLKKAIKISGEAMIECMKSVKPGMREEQLRAVYNFVCKFLGAKTFGFPTTIRSGPMRYGEHFPRSSKIMKSGELVTIDAGAEINHYTADIQRTFPVSGKFTQEQRRVYNILKKAQEACINLVRPGVTMKDLQEKAIEVLDKEGGYGKYFFWGTSHFLGMEVHDHGNNLLPFKPGIVITVEPGIVMPEFSIVLEDDILCTKNGYDWLTKFIPREIEDIEKVMRQKGIGKFYHKRN